MATKVRAQACWITVTARGALSTIFEVRHSTAEDTLGKSQGIRARPEALIHGVVLAL